ncbi:zf-HC2 domain-containing protein [Streptomyces roseoverticillatus]|uniref:zf-HC2 domain-containing protein n=1 Tax=Streptomyces roseoverticillatus TaxID=66429 RepID=UPI001F1D169E|nr:zf-HC2 domain-containing protein [Streptomyces roseoverticillatus]MCF3102742.1 zf-HC2 domain-containing protein [Streptomyces roseoverticillatus]
MTGSGGQSPAELHLGDRLAALVDGELGHDSRERVLAHLATCWTCKAEADAQRRIKSVFAEAAPPPLSENFLARLQGLAGGDPHAPLGTDRDGPEGRESAGGPGKAGPAARAEALAPLGLLPGGVRPGARPREGGFRIHEMPEPPRGGIRGRRIAFAAAGAVSLAAFALGGASPLTSVSGPQGPRAENPRTATTPLSAPSSGARDERRRLARTASQGGSSAGPGSSAVVPVREVSLLRPSVAPPLPPLIRNGHSAPGAPPADAARR